jgi:hypothetical protein
MIVGNDNVLFIGVVGQSDPFVVNFMEAFMQAISMADGNMSHVAAQENINEKAQQVSYRSLRHSCSVQLDLGGYGADSSGPAGFYLLLQRHP